MRRKSDRVKTSVASSPAKRSSRRSKRSASDTEEKTQNSDNEHSEQNSGSEQDSDHQPIAKSRKKLSRNTKSTNDEKPVRSRRGRPAKNIETVTEEDEEADTTEQDNNATEGNDVQAETLKSSSPEPVKIKSPVRVPAKIPTVEAAVIVEDVASSEPVVVEITEKTNPDTTSCTEDSPPNEQTEQNNGSSEEIVTSSVDQNEDVQEKVDDDSRTRSKASKDQPIGRRKHRKSSSDNNEAQSSEVVKDSPRKRRNRFSSPIAEQEKIAEESEPIKDASSVNEEPAKDDVPIISKTPERELVKDIEKPQESDGRKSRGEKENKDKDKDKKKSDEKVTSSEKKQKPVRKRKWLTQKSTEPKPQILAISTDSLKNLISDVKPVPLSDVKLESSPEPEEVEIVSKNETSKVINDSRDRLNRKEHRSESKQDKKHDEKSTSASNRKISIVHDDTAKVQRPPSPPKFSSSNILFITNLVRPFTVLQLKGLLTRTGKILDDGFWIDKIKSKCYVKYETEDQAVETRHALHGVRWPASNPKCLNVDFGSEKNMDKAIASTSEQMPKEGVSVVREERVSGGWDRFEVDDRKELAATTRPMREWDVGKKEDLGREREKERERDRNRDRERERDTREDLRGGGRAKEVDRLERRKRTPDLTHSVSPARKFHKKENEPPIRLLDDLFRKTKTVPCVYWLPLTSEQIALKEEERRKQLAEHKRRIEQREKERNDRERERERDRRDRESNDRRREQSRNKEGDRNERDRDRERRRY